MQPIKTLMLSLVLLIGAGVPSAWAQAAWPPKPPSNWVIDTTSSLYTSLAFYIPYTEGSGNAVKEMKQGVMVCTPDATFNAWQTETSGFAGPSSSVSAGHGWQLPVSASYPIFQASANVSSGFSWVYLYKPDDAANHAVTRVGDSDTIAGFVLYPTNNNTGTFTVAPRDGSNVAQLQTFPFAATPNWVMVAAVYDPATTNKLVVYSNTDVSTGAYTSTMSAVVSYAGANVTNSWGTGSAPVYWYPAGTKGASAFPQGRLALSAGWTKPLSAAEVNSLFVNPWQLLKAPSNPSGQISLMTASTNAPSVSATNYAPIQCGGINFNATESTVAQVIPVAGTFHDLRIRTAANASTTTFSSGKSYAWTVRKNSADTALTCTQADAEVTASDAYNSFTVAAGDLVDLKCVPTGTPVTLGITTWSIAFTANAPNQTIWMHSCTTAAAHNATTYTAVMYDHITNTTEANAESVVPTAGTISALTLSVDTAPGGSDSYAITLMKNGVASALTATVSASGTTATDGTHSVSVIAGDTVSWRIVGSATATDPQMRLSCVFAPTIGSECCVLIPAHNTVAQASTSYLIGSAAANATETNRTTTLQPCVAKNLRVLCTGIASGQTATVTVRKELGAGAATCVITGTGTTGSDTTNTVSFGNEDRLALQVVTSATSGTVRPAIGLVLDVPQPSLAARRGPSRRAGSRSARLHSLHQERNRCVAAH